MSSFPAHSRGHEGGVADRLRGRDLWHHRRQVHKAAGGEVTVTDGPFAETKEVLGGYALLNAASKEEARRIAPGRQVRFGSSK